MGNINIEDALVTDFGRKSFEWLIQEYRVFKSFKPSTAGEAILIDDNFSRVFDMLKVLGKDKNITRESIIFDIKNFIEMEEKIQELRDNFLNLYGVVANLEVGE